MRKPSEDFPLNTRVQWQDDDDVGQMGYVMANLSTQYLIRPDLNTQQGECFVFKNNPSLKRSKQ